MGWEVLACTIALLISAAAAESESGRVFPLNPGNAASFHDPVYKIEFHEPGSHYVPEDTEVEMMSMTNRDGRKFECFLPKQEAEVSSRNSQQQNENEITIAEEDSSMSRKSPQELLDPLKDNCVLRHEGWWTYELCYQGKFRQIHFEKKEKETQEFVLGVYDPEATALLHLEAPVQAQKDPRSQTAAQKYYAQMYTNGTKCDLTNTPRETEVRFVCSEGSPALISSIKESPTCKYIVVFHAPMLCKHPLFQEERQPWLVVNCNALSSSDKVEATEEAVPEHENVKEQGSVAKELISQIEMLPVTVVEES